jgi:hypothetical protein
VPDFSFNVLNRKGLLYRAVADEHRLASGGVRPTWPNGKRFAVCLTHDIDEVADEEFWRRRWAEMKRNPSLRTRLNNLLELGCDWFRYKGGREPFHFLEWWLNVEAQIDAHATLFFWPGIGSVMKRHKTDCQYDLMDRVTFDGQKSCVAELIQEIRGRSCEVGLHASWFSFNDTEEMKRQKEALANVVKRDILSVRQHYLHYDIRITPSVHYEAGLKYDSTLGFNDNIGFRFGTCHPWHLYDLKGEKEIPVLEVPLIIQDTAMLNPAKGMRLDEETAFQYLMQITERVEEMGGVLTLLWHPNRVLQEGQMNLFLRTLRYLKEKDVWFGSVEEIGQWWEDTKKKERSYED